MKKIYLFIVVFLIGALSLAGSADRILSTYKMLFREAGGANVITMQPPALSADYTLTLPTSAGSSTQALITDGSGNLSWVAISGITGTVAVGHGGTGITSGTSGGVPYFSSTSTIASSGLLAQYGVMLGGGAAAAPVTITPDASTAKVLVSGGNAANPAWNTIADASISSSAGIAVSKLAALTASRAVVTDASGFVSAATTTSTEIGYVNGVTSSIQTQLNGKLSSALATTTKTTTYTATTADGQILVDASGGAWTLTLYNPVGNTGAQLVITKTDSSTNAVTLGSYNVQGATRKLCTQYESVTLISDGTNWQVLNHYTDTPIASWTPTGSWVSNSTYTGTQRRMGQYLLGTFKVATSAAPTAAALTITLPAGRTIDTTYMVDTNAALQLVGQGSVLDGGTQFYQTQVAYNSTTTVIVQSSNASGTYATTATSVSSTVPITFGNTDEVIGTFMVPIVDWW